MLQSQLVPLAQMVQKGKTGLHWLLVIGTVLYVYSPILDHWLDRDYYARPHSHIHLPENILIGETEDLFSENSDHEENVLCLLDIKIVVYVISNVNAVLIVQNAPLIFDLFPYYLQGFTVYLSSLDPPPRIDS